MKAIMNANWAIRPRSQACPLMPTPIDRALNLDNPANLGAFKQQYRHTVQSVPRQYGTL